DGRGALPCGTVLDAGVERAVGPVAAGRESAGRGSGAGGPGAGADLLDRAEPADGHAAAGRHADGGDGGAGAHRPAAAAADGGRHAGDQAVGRDRGGPAHRHAGQRPQPGGDGDAAELGGRAARPVRDPRHHRGADGGLAGGAAPDEDRRGGPADGRGVRGLRHPAGDRADHGAPRARPGVGPNPGQPRRRAGLLPARTGRRHRERVPDGCGPTVIQDPSRAVAGHATVPVLRLGDILLVTLQGDLYDSTAQQLQQDLSETIVRSGVTGVVIDISGVEMVDSFLGRVLAEIAAQTELLAARTVVAGMRPAVAITLVELGLTLPGLRTALNTEVALEMLSQPVVLSGPAGWRGEGAWWTRRRAWRRACPSGRTWTWCGCASMCGSPRPGSGSGWWTRRSWSPPPVSWPATPWCTAAAAGWRSPRSVRRGWP